MKKTINIKFLVILVLGLGVTAVGVHFLHGYQVRRNTGALLDQAHRFEQAGDLVKAATYFRRYLGFEPSDTDRLEEFGLVLDRLGQEKKSRKLRGEAFLRLEQVLVRDPKRSELRRSVVDLAMAVGAYKEAIVHINKLMEESGKDVVLLQKRADCEVVNKQYTAAVETLAAALALPNQQQNVDLYRQRAAIYRVRLDNTEAARKVLGEMIEANPDSVEARLARANFLLSLPSPDKRDFETAAVDAAVARECAKDTPEQARAVLLAAQVLRAQDDVKAARALLTEAMQHKSKEISIALIQLEVAEGNLDRADELMQEALQNFPNDTELRLTKASVLLSQGKIADAQMVLAALQKETGDPLRLDLLQAQVHARKGEWGKALPLLQKLRAQLPKSSPHASVMAQLLGECYEQLGNPDQALLAYQEAFQADPLSARARMGRANAHMALGQFTQAAAEYREVLRLRQAPAAVRLLLVRALIAQNLRLPASKQDWQEIESQLRQAAATKELAQSVDVIILRAQVMLLSGQPTEKAKRFLEEEIGRRVADAQPARAELWLALAAIEGRDKAERAIDILDKAQQVPDLKDNLSLTLGRIRYLARLPEAKARAALQALEDKARAAPAADRQRLISELASAYYGLNEKAKARQLLAEVARELPNNLALRLVLFDLALEAADKQGMRQIVEDIRRIEGDSGTYWRYAEANRLVAEVTRDEDKKLENAELLLLAKASKHLADIAPVRDKWYRIPALQGQIADLEGFKLGASDNYQKAVELGDRRTFVVRRLWDLLVEQKRFAEAAQVVMRLLDQEESLVAAGLGKLAANALLPEDSDRALKVAERSLSGNPTYRDLLWHGQILWAASETARSEEKKLSLLREAEKRIRQAREKSPDAPETWSALVRFLVAAGRPEDAKSEFEQAKKQLAKLPVEKSGLPLAAAAEVVGDVKAAETYYTMALNAKADSPVLIALAAAFHLRHLQYDKAETLLKKLFDGSVKVSKEQAAAARREQARICASRLSYKHFKEGLRLIDVNLQERNNRPADLLTKANLLASRALYRKQAIRLFEDLHRTPGLLGAKELFTLAQLYQQEGNDDRYNLTMLDLLRLPEGKNPAYIAHIAHHHLAKKDVRGAKDWLREMEKSDRERKAESFLTLEIRARVLQAEGKHPQAIAEIQHYAQRKNAEVLRAARLLEILGHMTPKDEDYAKTAETLFRAAVANSEKRESHLLYAEFLARKKRAAEALDQCELALKQKGTPETVLSVALAVLRTTDAPDELQRRAEAWIRDARKTSETVGLLLLEADYRDLRGEYDEAIRLYRQVLAKNPDNLVALNNLAWMLALRAAKGEEALALLERGFDLVGPTAELLDTRSVVYLAMRRPEQALKDVDLSLEISTSAASFFHRARIHFARGDMEKAQADFARAKNLGLTESLLHPLERDALRELQKVLKRS